MARSDRENKKFDSDNRVRVNVEEASFVDPQGNVKVSVESTVSQYVNILNTPITDVILIEYDVDKYPLRAEYNTKDGVRLVTCIWNGDTECRVKVTDDSGLVIISDFTYFYSVPNLQRAIIEQRTDLPARTPDVSEIVLTPNQIKENSLPGDTIGAFSVTGGVGPYTFSILNDPDNLFQISGPTLELSTDTDGRGNTSSSVIVEVTDSNLKTFSQTLSVDFLESPEITDIIIDNDTINSDSAAGTLIGVLSSVGGTGPFTYALTSNPGGALQIVGDELQMAIIADLATGSYTVDVSSTDSRGRQVVTTITVTVLQAPLSDITLTNSTIVNQAVAGSLVGELGAVGGAEPRTFSIQSDPDNKFQVVGNQLQITNTPNLVDGSYSVTIRATDNDLLTFDKLFSIAVTPRVITDVTLDNNTVASGTTSGTVGLFNLVGGEGISNVSIVSDPENVFATPGVSLAINNEVLIGSSPYSVTISAEDSVGQTFDKTFQVFITYQNKYSFRPNSSSSGQSAISPGAGITLTDGQTPFSIAFWIKRIALQSFTIFSNTSGTGNNTEGIIIRTDTNSSVRYQFRLNRTGTSRLFARLNSNAPLNTWHHVVMTYDGSQALSGVEFYYNGALGARTNSTNSLNGVINNTNDYAIMSRFNGAQASNGSALIEQFLVVGKELSAAEVAELYNGGNTIDVTDLSFYTDIERSYNFEKSLQDRSLQGADATGINFDGSEFSTDVP